MCFAIVFITQSFFNLIITSKIARVMFKLILWMYPVTRSTSVENDIHRKKMTTGQLV